MRFYDVIESDTGRSIRPGGPYVLGAAEALAEEARAEGVSCDVEEVEVRESVLLWTDAPESEDDRWTHTVRWTVHRSRLYGLRDVRVVDVLADQLRYQLLRYRLAGARVGVRLSTVDMLSLVMGCGARVMGQEELERLLYEARP